MPAAVAIPGIVGGIATSLIGSSAANKAAQLQTNAGNAASKQILDAANTVNPTITNAGATAGATVQNAASGANAGVNSATDRANGLLSPYANAGQDALDQLMKGIAPGGSLSHQFTGADMLANDPGYAFRMQQGEKALTNSASAHGGTLGGAAGKAFERYGQDYGSNEFNGAFNRYQTQQNTIYSRLSDLTKMGDAAAGTQGDRLISGAQYGGNNDMTAGQYAGNALVNATNTAANNTLNATAQSGNYLTNAGAAQAAGTVGAANSINSGIMGGVNAANGAITLSQLLKNPALQRTIPAPNTGTAGGAT